MNKKLTFLERLSYGLGDYAGNLIYSSITAFLLVYYVTVVGMNSAVAASVMAISKIFDGISDLLMGRIVDKSHSKYGKARPWIIRMSIPMGICAVFMFSVPASFSSKAQVVYAFLTYNLVSTVFYTGYNVPYATLQGLMTTNQYERGLLGNFRMLLATAGTMTVNTFVLKMTAFFGNGEDGDAYTQRGWTITMIIMAAAFIAISFITFLNCKEAVDDEEPSEEEKAAAAEAKAKEPSFIQGIASLLKNKYWILMVIFLFVLYFMMSTFFGSNLYFAKYVLGREEKYSIIANALTIAQIGMMFITPFVMKVIGKRWTGFIGMAVSLLGFILTAAAGQNVTMVVVANVIKGAGFGFGAATMFGLLQDSITYGQWLTNVPAIGMGNAASSFAMKIGSGIGTAALGWILGAGGFDNDPTSASAITSINVACIWVPVITCLIGLICLLFFDLDKKYDLILADLEAGKWKGTSDLKL
jgi:GPH family glycoside/pentoside/hexuronide:cation symporter